VTSGRRLQSGGVETRIVGIYLRNSNLSGEFPVAAVQAMKSLRVLDLKNDPNGQYSNSFTIPANATGGSGSGQCVTLQPCYSTVTCDLPVETPVCNPPSSGFSGGAIAGIIIGVLVVALGGGFAYYNSSKRAAPPAATTTLAAAKSPAKDKPTKADATPTKKDSPAAQDSRGESKTNVWQEAFDSQNNAPYWVNSITGEFSWTNPNGDKV